ncbi:acyl carrier protein [Sporolactobacillus sp. THM7-7]|nr:acyl carrier protein [Sporolactobacillus sp. THM7-7]
MEKSLTKEKITEKVKEVVATQLQVEQEKIKNDSLFVDDLGADSLDLTELAIAFEDAFDLEIPESDFGQLSTVAGVVDYLSERMK